jgi:iron complex outermembrane receptor protein
MFQPTNNTLLYVFGSINESEIQDDVQLGVDAAGNPTFAPTAGKNESGTPLWSVGARGQIALGPVELGAQVKHTGKRWVNDINDLSVDGYTLVDLDVRVRLGEYFNGKDAALQFNVTNLFDEFYVGGFGGDLDGVGFAQMGPPRAATVSLILGY